jgi:4-hydroxy-3-polyprenylbenzoate decarboxylase
VTAITGASGAAYGRRLVQLLAEGGADVHLVISTHGLRVLADELGLSRPAAEDFTRLAPERIRFYGFEDVGCKLASGSFITDAMVICPCSSNTLAAVASGLADNLICRAAQVALKESRRLIVCPREMPVGQVEIRNMLLVSQAGGLVCPASPAFYMQPRSVGDVVDSVVGRVLDLLGVEHSLDTRWSDQLEDDG